MSSSSSKSVASSYTALANYAFSKALGVAGGGIPAPTIYGTLALGNFPAGGPIGTAAATVDLYTLYTINQTTAGQTLSLPAPTNTITGRTVFVTNIGSVDFTMQGLVVQAARAAFFIWDEPTAAWHAMSDQTGVGAAWQQGGNAFGAVGTLGTSDNFALRFIANSLEVLRLPTVAGAVNNLQISASATGSAILIQPIGTDAAIPIHYLTKAGGRHRFLPGSDSTTAFQVTNAAQSVPMINVDTVNSRLGIGTTSPAAGFHNAFATLWGTSALANFPAGGAIGAAAATVDVFTSFTVNQTTAGQTLSLPTPTDTTTGRWVLITNIGSTAFTMHNTVLEAGKTTYFVWENAGGTGSPAWRGLENSDLIGFTGPSNTGLGVSAGTSLTTGLRDTVMGVGAGNALTSGNDVTAFGFNALALSNQPSNSAFGSQALASDTTGGLNTAVGFQALTTNATSSSNTAVGASSLASAVGSTGVGNNTAVGATALNGLTSGTSNTAVGAGSLAGATLADNCTAVGRNALNVHTTPSGLTAVGALSLAGNTTGSSNTAVGFQSLLANTSGNFNTAVGYEALLSNTITNNNVAVGYNALRLTTVANNTAVGTAALDANTTGTQLVATGTDALGSNTTGSNNTAYGFTALLLNTTGNFNTAVGSQALAANTITNNNVAVGYNALTVSTAANNTAVGTAALDANTTGTRLVGTGTDVLGSNTTGTDNTAYGFTALLLNTTGNFNTAVGSQALAANTITNNNVAVGYNALTVATTANNTAVGTAALDASTSGTRLVAMGTDALGSNTTGSDNTAIGFSAISSSTTGSGNTGLGVSVGTGATSGTALTTGINNTLIGQNADVSAAAAARRIAIGSGSNATVDDGLFFPTALATLTSGTAVTFNPSTGQLGPTQAIGLTEFASVPGGAPAAGAGKLWIRNNAPNTLIFTDDVGTDHLVSPVYGLSKQSVASIALAPAATDVDITGTDITVTVPGEYALNFSARGGSGAAGEVVVYGIHDITAGSLVTNSECLAAFSLTTAYQATCSREIYVTVSSVPRTYRLKAQSSAGTGVSVDNGAGRTYLAYRKL